MSNPYNHWRTMEMSKKIEYGVAIAMLVIAILVCTGCATKATTEFIDADGTSFKAISKAGPFGQLDTTNQQMAYKWDANAAGSIAVGNEAQGLDNSGQVVALEAGVGAVTDLVKVLGPLLAAPRLPGSGGESPDLLDKYERLCVLLCRIAPEQSGQFCGCNE